MNPTQALIAIIEEVRGGMSAECTSEGCTCGDGWSHDDPDLLARLDVAIKAAKAAEEGVETAYVVETRWEDGWSPVIYDARFDDVEAARRRRKRVGKVSSRVARKDTYTTVIEVREKEGL